MAPFRLGHNVLQLVKLAIGWARVIAWLFINEFNVEPGITLFFERAVNAPMGFQRTTYKLVFEGDLTGLEIRTRGASIAQAVRCSAILSMGAELIRDTEESQAARDELISMLAKRFLAWNLEDESGEPVPCTKETLETEEDWSFLIAVAKAWMNAGVNVTSPLEEPSADGVPPMVAATPMEILS